MHTSQKLLQLKRRIKAKLGFALAVSLRSAHGFFSPYYNLLFDKYIDRACLDSNDLILRHPALRRLDRNLNYYVFHASYGDKWLILSFLAVHLRYYPATRVLAAETDQSLVEIFIGTEETCHRFIFIKPSQLQKINSYFSQRSRLTQQVVDFNSADTGLSITKYVLANGLPVPTLRPLHIVSYPYFSDLMNIHAVGYGPLLRMILYLPAKVNPAVPEFYSHNHYKRVESVLGRGTYPSDGALAAKGTVLINPVNFSHQGLSAHQLIIIVQCIIGCDYRILMNYAQGQCPDTLHQFILGEDYVDAVSVPPDLLALVCSKVDAVIGVLGGAMSVAAQFGRAHVLSLQTPGKFLGCDDDEYLADSNGSRLWEWVHQDWPCLHEGRVVQNKWIGDPALISEDHLRQVVQGFFSQLPLPQTAPSRIS